jgi:competence protein ComEA
MNAISSHDVRDAQAKGGWDAPWPHAAPDVPGVVGAEPAVETAGQRAAALFGGGAPPVAAVRPEPPPGGPGGSGVPGVPAFGDGPVGRLRSWLFVRCGLEFKTVLTLAVVLAVAVGIAAQHYWAGRPRTVRVPPPSTAAAPVAVPSHLPGAGPTVPGPAARVTVDVAGKVAKPGLRELRKGARVADALAAAGGALPGTDTTALNLARPLTDGEQILVGVPAPAPAPGPPAAGAPAAPSPPVSLSTATAAQLDALPGVGPVLAQHIIAFRAQHGPFTSVRQLHQIPGIGPRKFATLQPLVQP